MKGPQGQKKKDIYKTIYICYNIYVNKERDIKKSKSSKDEVKKLIYKNNIICCNRYVKVKEEL